MKFVVVDLSGTESVADLQAYADAQQTQLREHYSKCFDGDGVEDEVRVAVLLGDIQPGEVAIFLHPVAPVDQQAALGFHDRQDDGTPIINVFLDLAASSGTPWQSICSHEVLETRADPRLHATVQLDDGTVWDREVADRVEADSYTINSVPMSNFNTPSCFEPPNNWQDQIKAPTLDPGLFDWMGCSGKPNEVRTGGYAQKFDPSSGNWTQVGTMRAYRAALHALGMTRSARRVKASAVPSEPAPLPPPAA